MKPLVRGNLYITDFRCLPDEITRALGVEPSGSWMAGDRIGISIRTFESNGWMLESRLPGETDPEVHVRELLDRIPEQVSERLRKVTPEWSLQLSLVIEMQDETPPFNLSADTLQRMVSLGASLDVDLYVTGQGSPGPG